MGQGRAHDRAPAVALTARPRRRRGRTDDAAASKARSPLPPRPGAVERPREVERRVHLGFLKGPHGQRPRLRKAMPARATAHAATPPPQPMPRLARRPRPPSRRSHRRYRSRSRRRSRRHRPRRHASLDAHGTLHVHRDQAEPARSQAATDAAGHGAGPPAHRARMTSRAAARRPRGLCVGKRMADPAVCASAPHAPLGVSSAPWPAGRRARLRPGSQRKAGDRNAPSV